jgi:hypothetical protein
LQFGNAGDRNVDPGNHDAHCPLLRISLKNKYEDVDDLINTMEENGHIQIVSKGTRTVLAKYSWA